MTQGGNKEAPNSQIEREVALGPKSEDASITDESRHLIESSALRNIQS